jgi:hypothetical protein
MQILADDRITTSQADDLLNHPGAIAGASLKRDVDLLVCSLKAEISGASLPRPHWRDIDTATRDWNPDRG